MARLMMSEIHGLRFLERDRTYLIVGRRLSSVIAYSLLKNTERNDIDKVDIYRFLVENGYSPSERDIEAIFWRLDHNKDGKLTYQDFCQIYDD
jgi:Ca2+-binding EF-hand superfamily protein